MHAHKLKITVPQDHQVEIRLPEDFPPGPAEVIILSSFRAESRSQQPWTKLLEPHPVLGKIVFHEDPSKPLDPEDWPEVEELPDLDLEERSGVRQSAATTIVIW